MRTILLVLLAVTACGDDHNITVDAAPMHDSRPVDAAPPVPRAVVVAPSAMFGVPPGIMSALDVPTLAVDKNIAAGLVGSDPFLRTFGGELYIVNRGDANITIVNATTLEFEEQIGTGVGTSPQDVAVVGQKLYVPASGTMGVVVLTRGSTTKTTIDLTTAVGDLDNDPNCISAYTIGTNVFVACDDLNNNNPNQPPRGPGRIAVIDTTTDTVTTTISMPVNNPQSLFQRSPMDSMFGGDLLIASEPDFNDLTQGCLTRVSVGASPVASCAIQNSATGGAETHYDIQVNGAAETLWLAVSVDFTHANLQTFDLVAGTLGSAPISASTEETLDVAVCPDGSIVATDNTMTTGGMRVYSSATKTEKTTTALDIGLPPGFGNGLVCFDH